MRNLLHSIHTRLGDFWWYSILIFIACRSGDAVQAFIGLWLVPHYVPQGELGAALPLLQIGNAFGLPLSILIIPFSRWLTLYAVRGEYGKVKRMLSLAFRSVFFAFAIAVIAAHFILPHFFNRMRIAEGSLGILIICTGLIGPFSGVFGNALQGLKRFRTMAFVNAIGAPVRLVVMLVTMPFRALAGYMLGQLAAPAMSIFVSILSLRKALGKEVRTVPLGREDVKAMVRYTLPVALNLLVATVMGTWQALLIRQRLPEVESAGFYVISRLAEVAAYAGMSLSVVVFPFAAEAREKGENGNGLLWRLLGGTLLPGLVVAVLFACFGRQILSIVPLWRDYVAYGPLLALFTLRLAICTTYSVFSTYEIAAGRFAFLWYWIPFAFLETGVLVVLTGYGAFQGILPPGVLDWMASVGAARLDFFVWWLFGCSMAQMFVVVCHVLLRSRLGSCRGEAGCR